MLYLQRRSGTTEAWAATTLTTAALAFEIAASALAANLSLWGNAMKGMSVFAAAPPSPVIDQQTSIASLRNLDTDGLRVRSWYRAPYRSPLNPLFWIESGYSLDHATLWPALRTPWALATPSGHTHGLAPSAMRGIWLSAWSPWWGLPWAVGTVPSAPAAKPNVVDFQAAYASYRTAGGHASAQIAARGGTGVALKEPARSVTWEWPLAYPFSLWLSRMS